jgi:hypothetical protein
MAKGESGESGFDVVHNTFDHELPELLPPGPRSDERPNFCSMAAFTVSFTSR